MIIFAIKFVEYAVRARQIGPALSKESFPVGRVDYKKASREVGTFFFFFSYFHFL